MATTITANGINFPDGSASAPSIGGTDTNTGLFTGSDIVGFATGGVERIRIDANGKVCINNDTALSDLHICTAGSSEEDGTLRVGGTAASLGLVIDYDQSAATVSRITANPTYSNDDSLLKICVDGDANPNQLVLRGDGNIGIGINDTSADLQIVGSSSAGLLRVGGNQTNGVGLDISYDNSSTTTTTFKQNYRATNAGALIKFDSGYFTFHTGTAGGERLRITSGGSVNIGGDYTQSTYKTQITGDLLIQKAQAAYDHPQIELYASNNTAHGGAIKFSAMYGSKYQLAKIRATGGSGSPNSSGGGLHFFTGDGSRKVEFQPDGDVAIVDGNLVVASGHGVDFSATANGTGSSQAELFDDYETGAWTGSITTGGGNVINAWYIKVGRLVFVTGACTAWGNTTSSNSIQVTGLPFSVNVTGYGQVVFAKHVDAHKGCWVEAAGTTLYFLKSSTGSGSADYLYHSGIVQTSGSASFSLWYRTT